MKNVLVLSNCCVSNTESNGRIHSFLIKSKEIESVHIFYVRGTPDFDGVKYISVSPRKALFSKITFGLYNAGLSEPECGTSSNKSLNPKSKKVFYHCIRSFAYLNNRRIIKNLSDYIIINNIDSIYLWGCNVPFLYNYAWKLAKKNNLNLVTFTGEDYPLKNYNYISFKKSIFFPCFQRRFFKETRRVYELSNTNYFANKELCELYKNRINLKHFDLCYFKSELERVNKTTNKIRSLIYAGNLYDARAVTLLKFASYLEKFSDVVINVYGNAHEDVVSKLNSSKNIKYHGIVPYSELLEILKTNDMLLHIEGFDKDFVNDFKYAFSTKISDYFALGMPMFVYGPIEISGVKFCKEMIPNFTACTYEELQKLDDIIFGKVKFDFDYNIVERLFK